MAPTSTNERVFSGIYPLTYAPKCTVTNALSRHGGGGPACAATYSPYQAMAARARTAATGE